MTTGEYNDCVDRYSDNVYRFVLKSLRDTEAAKDIVQESFLRLWENRQKVEPSRARSYLFTVAYHLLVDNTRVKSRYTGEENIHTTAGENRSEFTSLNEILSEELDTLPETQKRLVLLRDYEGYSYREIGELTGLSESQVKVYLFRARAALKVKIGSVSNVL